MKNKNLKFANKYKAISSKNGGMVLIILDDGTCITIPALKILRQALISLSIKERNQRMKDNEAA